MAAVYVSNIVINAGSDFNQIYNLESSSSNSPLDLTGYTIRSQMRKHSTSSNYFNFNTSIINVLSGTINIGLTSSITINIKPGRYIYDIIVSKNSITTRVIEGMALVREGATK